MNDRPASFGSGEGATGDAVAQLIRPKPRDIGGFEVRRVLPAPGRRMIGPFVFFDQVGPADFAAGQGIDVRPHPHVCLATVTYLFEGMLMHRDSLGSAQLIEPGAVNLMTAGRGIVHSERAGPDRSVASRLHGIQSWMALPAAHEETDPDFSHYPATSIPSLQIGDAQVRVVLGEAFGSRSPVKVFSTTLYLDVRLPAGSRFHLPRTVPELAVHVVEGDVAHAGERVEGGVMAVLREGHDLQLEALSPARLIVIGGEPLGERHIWWNFVASDPVRIERAKDDWSAGRFPHVPGDEEEFIPLPD
jgi:redox-sensitive bicupin YhaK (pirin superfamily)